MRTKTRTILSILVAGLVLGFVIEAQAQRVTQPSLRGNPKRDIGGSCVYSKEGKVVFAPAGKNCPDATDHLSKPTNADSPILAGYPPAMREELAKLLGDHDHISQEISRLRQAVERRNREVALEAVDKIRAEVTDHRAREEVFFEKMAPNRDSP